MMQHHASRSRLLPSRTELLVVLVVLSGGVLLLAPLLKGPVGKRIPTEPPNEARRLVHPAGFSIVVPPNWKAASAELTKDWPSLGLLPIRPLPVRSSASIYIMRYDRQRPPELERAPQGRFRAFRFQGQPAYELMEVVREATFPDEPALSQYTRYIQQGEDWYLISYTINERLAELPDAVRQYIDTFQAERVPAREGQRDPD